MHIKHTKFVYADLRDLQVYGLLDEFLFQLRKSAPHEREMLYNKSDPRRLSRLIEMPARNTID